jgi:predicted nucleotidyltransferase
MATLRARAEEIRARGVTRLSLFGSTVRDQAADDSDVDLLVDLDPDRRLSLIDFAALRLYLADVLGCDVDVAQRQTLKPRIRDAILAEAQDIL